MNIISLQEGHTATASLSINGKIVACASEERFLRKKNWEGYPRNAINFLIKKYPVKIDKVIFTGLYSPALSILGREHNFSMEHHIRQQREHFYPIFYKNQNPYKTQKKFFDKLIKEFKIKQTDSQYLFEKKYKFTCDPQKDLKTFKKIRFKTVVEQLNIPESDIEVIDHHKGHVYYAYFASPFRRKKCLIVTADGDGDYGINLTYSIASKDKIKEIYRSANQPIAKIWRYFTIMLGMKPQQHEYKVMGLAPYANEYISRKVYNELNNHFGVRGVNFFIKKNPQDLYFYFKKKFEGVRFDGLAGGLQLWTEDLAKKWFKNVIRKTGINRVVFSGGLSMNIKLNKALSEIKEIKEFYVPATGGDESLPIGGCYYKASKKTNPKPLDNIYLGPDFSNEEVLKLLKFYKTKGKIKYKKAGQKEVAKLLHKNKIVARFFGRMEFGARALGNRSILANPSNFDVVKKINHQIKMRDFWMPFTPIVLKEKSSKYIINKKKIDCPHMTIAFDTTKLGQRHFKAAIHPHDYTMRPQLLKKNDNENLYILIKEFEKLSKISGLLNTSFNLHGYPIVCSPLDALKTFLNSSLDYLYFNDEYLVYSNSKRGE
jgi:carbamoyltransferase